MTTSVSSKRQKVQNIFRQVAQNFRNYEIVFLMCEFEAFSLSIERNFASDFFFLLLIDCVSGEMTFFMWVICFCFEIAP